MAFFGCKRLESITIPNGVTSIGGSAFSFCSGLETITVDKNNQNYTDTDGVLFNKDCTELICFPKGRKGTYEITDSITAIGNKAFFGCKRLESITIPNGVKSIGHWAFWSCSGLESVTIPNSVTTIGDEAFKYCNGLKKVVIPKSFKKIRKKIFDSKITGLFSKCEFIYT